MTSTKVPSPVKVAAHKWDVEDMERENDRRFSSNFVRGSTTVSLPVKVVKHKSDMERSKHERRFSSNFVPLPAAYEEEEAKVQVEEDDVSPRPGRCLCTHVHGTCMCDIILR